MQNLSERIRSIRKSQGLTQLDVADKCNISASAYGQIERNANYCCFETLLKISQALNVSIVFLIDIDSEKYKI
jgi:transcriptional regulator with XRE-family HTH domain